ncbi:unnamed protein product, partial [Cutaneotrichosporon oleaginosum]
MARREHDGRGIRFTVPTTTSLRSPPSPGTHEACGVTSSGQCTYRRPWVTGLPPMSKRDASFLPSLIHPLSHSQRSLTPHRSLSITHSPSLNHHARFRRSRPPPCDRTSSSPPKYAFTAHGLSPIPSRPLPPHLLPAQRSPQLPPWPRRPRRTLSSRTAAGQPSASPTAAAPGTRNRTMKPRPFSRAWRARKTALLPDTVG